MRSRLNTTTALIASLSLFAPSPVPAQEAAPETPADVPLMCPDGSDLPCAEGVIPVPAVDGEAAPEENAPEAAEETAPDAESSETAPEATEDQPAADAAEEPPATEAAPAETAEEPPVTEEAPAETAEEPPATEEAPAEAAEEPPATEEAPAETAEEPPVTEEAPAETAEEPPATEPEPAEPVLAPTEAPADPAEDQPEAEAAGTPPAGQETGATEETLPDAGDLGQALEGAAGDAAEAVPDLPVQPDAASGEAPVAAAAEAPAEAAEAEVTEEVVTEETARSSDEDFATALSQAASAATARDDDDDGLSDAEKAALVGLGAIAVGAILSNNRQVALNSGDRVVVTRDDGSYQIIKDDSALLRQPGSTVRTETFADGSTRTTVTRQDGSRIVTIRDAEYRVLRRAHVAPDGTQTVLIDDTAAVEPVVIDRLPPPAAQPILSADADEAALREALAREAALDRSFSLAQVRDIAEVRALVPVIDLTAITFETGSAAIRPDQAQSLSRLGNLIRSYIDENPREMFLIEGHTDAVGSAAYNLALSDRRAESVALALTEYFAVPPENMVVQGYGEAFLRVDTQEAERQNRRASVRRITDLLRQAAN